MFYNKDRASLTKLLVENIALAMTDTPTYVEWNYIHELFRSVSVKQRAWNIRALIKTFGITSLKDWKVILI
jgi:hypothetical protein